MRRISNCLIWSAILMVTATRPSPAQNQAGGVDRLWQYAGTWKMQIEHFDTPYSKAGRESTTLENDCWRSGQYIACRQVVDGDSRILLVFTCGSDGSHCTSYQIPPAGGEPGAGKLILEGDSWTFPWQTTEAGKTTWFRVVNVWSSPSTIEFRQEYSSDQVHWIRMATGHETKTTK